MLVCTRASQTRAGRLIPALSILNISSAVLARLGNMLDDARTLHRLELLQFDLKGGVAAGGHRNLFHHPSSSFNFMRTNPRGPAQKPKQNPLVTGEFQLTRASLPISWREQSP